VRAFAPFLGTDQTANMPKAHQRRLSQPLVVVATVCALVGSTSLIAASPIATKANGASESAGCPTSSISDESLSLTAGIGPDHAHTAVVDQGEGSVLSGALKSPTASVQGAFLCVYSRVLTDAEATLTGIAVTRPDGSFRFGVPPGPSRILTVLAQTPEGPRSTHAIIKTRVRPSLSIHPNPVHNRHFEYFSGRIPGPHSGKVTVVLQASDNRRRWYDAWHTSTRSDGRFTMRYYFSVISLETTFIFRVQVLGAPGYPYDGGYSRELFLRVLP
jgi:hypothetical protein